MYVSEKNYLPEGFPTFWSHACSHFGTRTHFRFTNEKIPIEILQAKSRYKLKGAIFSPTFAFLAQYISRLKFSHGFLDF